MIKHALSISHQFAFNKKYRGLLITQITMSKFQNINSESADQVYRPTKNKKYIDPCLDIEKIQIDYIEENIPSVEENSGDDNEGWFILEFVVLTNKFKEIKQVRKYSVQSLVGNLGGYIGLCLGYAVVNIPTMILKIWNKLKNFYFSQITEPTTF